MTPKNNVIGCINFLAVLPSIPIIGSGIWLATKPDNACVKILQWPLIILGILILVVSLLGFVGGVWRIQCLIIFYLIAMLILIVVLACVLVFVFMVTNSGSGHVVQGRRYLEYRLDDFGGWLKRRVENSNRWDRIRSCLNSSSMCDVLNQRFRLAQDFFNAHISPLQSGCCTPPTGCGHTFVNPTYWINPTNNAADMDCLQWSNEQTQLCYTCDSCKAGLLANLKAEWRRVDIILLITLIALVCVYLIGCCGFIRNAKTHGFGRRNKESGS